MTDPSDALSTFAEVAVALVGFSGIVIAFGRRSLGALTQLELRRLSNLFLFGGGVLLLSLAGIALLRTTLGEVIAWRCGSALIFGLGTPWTILDWRKVAHLAPAERVQVKSYIYYPFSVVGATVLLLQLGNALVIQDSWPFFLALAFAIAFALQQFILLVRMGIDDALQGDEADAAMTTHLRVARPVSDLTRSVAMYTRGLGFDVVGDFADHDGFDGTMIGNVGADFHLEFTVSRTHVVSPTPTKDDLLVFYVPEENAWSTRCSAMLAAGFKEVAPFNPYWAAKGRTYEDQDGYRVVLQQGSWLNGRSS